MSITKIELSNDDTQKLIDGHSNEFNSTMLDIVDRRVSNIKPNNILKNYTEKHTYFEPSKTDPRVYNEISDIFFNSVDNDFECIELSPINPIGLNSVLTETNQNNILSTLRNSEVVSDSSIAMALECAYRIRKEKISMHNLASSTRLLRMQSYNSGKKNHWSQHFRACSLTSSFRNIENNMYDSLILQVRNWLKVIQKISEKIKINSIEVNICYLPLIKEIYSVYEVNMKRILSNSVNPDFDVFKIYNIDVCNIISNMEEINNLNKTKSYFLSIKNTFEFIYNKIFNILSEEYPDIKFNLQLNRKSGLNYYSDICYEIVVGFDNEKSLVLVDGGITNWTGKILSDSKEKCVTSGMGLEYLAKVYKR